MEINFFESHESPQPRDKIRIEDVEITPYPDRYRVHLHIKVTPFRERPNLVIAAHDEQDRVVSELNVIETMHADMEFTLHMRGRHDPAGVYTLTVELYYETKNPPQDRHIQVFTIPEAAAGERQD